MLIGVVLYAKKIIPMWFDKMYVGESQNLRLSAGFGEASGGGDASGFGGGFGVSPAPSSVGKSDTNKR